MDKVSKNLTNIHKVMQESSELVLRQGEELDLVSDDLSKTLSNTTQANSDLSAANKYHQSKSKCCLWTILLLSFTVTCIVVAIVLLS